MLSIVLPETSFVYCFLAYSILHSTETIPATFPFLVQVTCAPPLGLSDTYIKQPCTTAVFPSTFPTRRSIIFTLYFRLSQPVAICLKASSIRCSKRSCIAFSFSARSLLLQRTKTSSPSGPSTSLTSSRHAPLASLFSIVRTRTASIALAGGHPEYIGGPPGLKNQNLPCWPFRGPSPKCGFTFPYLFSMVPIISFTVVTSVRFPANIS